MRKLLPTTAMRAWGVVPLVLLAGLATAGIAAYAMPGGRDTWAGTGALRVRPASRFVTAGVPAFYRVAIDQRVIWGRVAWWVLGLPKSARARIAVAQTRGAAMLTVTTSPATPAGIYRLELRAVGGFAPRFVPLSLEVGPPRIVPVQITGSVSGLEPGSPQALNLVLRNPNPSPTWVTRLSASLRVVRAPRASPAHPCGAADFSVRQYAGPYPLPLPGHGERTLSSLGIGVTLWPQIMLIDRLVNQDGCKGATVTLNLTGTALGL